MTLRKGLVLFLLLSFGVSAVVLLSSVDGETWSTPFCVPTSGSCCLPSYLSSLRGL